MEDGPRPRPCSKITQSPFLTPPRGSIGAQPGIKKPGITNSNIPKNVSRYKANHNRGASLTNLKSPYPAETIAPFFSMPQKRIPAIIAKIETALVIMSRNRKLAKQIRHRYLHNLTEVADKGIPCYMLSKFMIVNIIFELNTEEAE